MRLERARSGFSRHEGFQKPTVILLAQRLDAHSQLFRLDAEQPLDELVRPELDRAAQDRPRDPRGSACPKGRKALLARDGLKLAHDT